MKDEEYQQKMVEIIDKYTSLLHDELCERWDNWQIDLDKKEIYEVIGGLMARQVTLAACLAHAPLFWNAHGGPLVLRTMVDNCIIFAWIFEEPLERVRQYIDYGLGQEKLNIEHRKKLPESEINNEIIKTMEKWLESQRYAFLTDVNVGSWAGTDMRSMAEQADCKELYNMAYNPLSAATHNMWHHICKWNLIHCPNPLHKFHRVPYVPSKFESDFSVFYSAVLYVRKIFDVFDLKTGVKIKSPSAYDFLINSVTTLENTSEEQNSNVEKNGVAE